MTTIERRTADIPAEDSERMRHAVSDQLRKDRVPPPDILLEEHSEEYGRHPVGKEAFVGYDYHRREVEHLWAKVWQMACRERDVAKPGDFTTYEIVDESVIIARQADGELKAYHNVCQHRGNRLVEGCGSVGAAGSFSCTFHGWTWNLDGSLARVPCAWDFPDVGPDTNTLKEIPVGTWDGWVFVNFDPAAEPFADFLGDVIPRHFQQWPLGRRRLVTHAAKVLPCNWKVALGAFMETYHVFRAHPEAQPFAYDAGSRYDQWGRHGRMIQLVGLPSPFLEEGTYEEQDVIDALLGSSIQVGVESQTPQIPEGHTARSFLAEVSRTNLAETFNVDLSQASDSEIVDAIEYFVFPNFLPWGGYGTPLVYRARPAGDDPNSCLFEIMLATAASGDTEADEPLTLLSADVSWTTAPGMPYGLGYILDQDTANVPKVQKGLRSSGLSAVNYAQRQEGNIRLLHDGVEEYLARGRA